MKSLDETNKDIVITNCDKGEFRNVFRGSSCVISVCLFIVGTIPGHISSIMKGSGRIFVFGVAPAEMKQIQGKLSAMSVDSIHTQIIFSQYSNVV